MFPFVTELATQGKLLLMVEVLAALVVLRLVLARLPQPALSDTPKESGEPSSLPRMPFF